MAIVIRLNRQEHLDLHLIVSKRDLQKYLNFGVLKGK